MRFKLFYWIFLLSLFFYFFFYECTSSKLLNDCLNRQTFDLRFMLILNAHQAVYFSGLWLWVNLLSASIMLIPGPPKKVNMVLSNIVVVSLWNIVNVMATEHWLLSCCVLTWKKIMERDQAKHYLEGCRGQKGGFWKPQTPVLLRSWLSVVKVDPARHQLHPGQFTYTESSPPFCVTHITRHQVWQWARRGRKAYVPSTFYLKQQTRCSHFHPVKWSSAKYNSLRIFASGSV